MKRSEEIQKQIDKNNAELMELEAELARRRAMSNGTVKTEREETIHPEDIASVESSEEDII